MRVQCSQGWSNYLSCPYSRLSTPAAQAVKITANKDGATSAVVIFWLSDKAQLAEQSLISKGEDRIS